MKATHNSSKGGITQAGRDHFKRNPDANLKPPVTKSNQKGKDKSRKKSLCARMAGVKVPMKDSKGRPTRKSRALKRWKC